MEYPFVTVLITTYNYAQFILEAIDSVINQTYPIDKIEILVLDDGSVDGTKEVLNALISENKIRYHYQENGGKGSASNSGIQKSSGKYIFNLDADDYFFPDKIIKTVEIFESDSDIVHVASPIYPFDDKRKILTVIENVPPIILGRPLDGNWLLNYFFTNNYLYGGGSTYAARASILKKINISADIDLNVDELLVIAILPFGKSFFIENPLSVRRNHSANYSRIFKLPTEKRLIAEQRKVQSSNGILDYLQKNNFDSKLVKIYKVKNLSWELALKEYTGTKNLSDIFNYASEIFFGLRPSVFIIKKYQVFNRLLPTSIFKFLKKIKNIIKHLKKRKIALK
jgi:glycosyltransferase involved in cell wall biosynthesis